MANVRSKLEAYRDLFLQSGAWQRMVQHFEAKKERPQYVQDLTKEINQIMVWYEARFREMDAYFGITDGVSLNPESSNPKSSISKAFDFSGRFLLASPASTRLVIHRGRKYLIR